MLALIARDWPQIKITPSTFASFGLRKCCAESETGGKLDGSNQMKGCCCCEDPEKQLQCKSSTSTLNPIGSGVCDLPTNNLFPVVFNSSGGGPQLHLRSQGIPTKPDEWSVKPHSMCGSSVAAFKRGTIAFDEVLVPLAECAAREECLMPQKYTEKERDKALLTLALRRFYAKHSTDEGTPLRHTCTHGPLFHGHAIRLDLSPFYKVRALTARSLAAMRWEGQGGFETDTRVDSYLSSYPRFR